MTRSWKHRTTLFQVWIWRRDACKGPEVGVQKREYALQLQTTLLLIKIQETIFLHARKFQSYVSVKGHDMSFEALKQSFEIYL